MIIPKIDRLHSFHIHCLVQVYLQYKIRLLQELFIAPITISIDLLYSLHVHKGVWCNVCINKQSLTLYNEMQLIMTVPQRVTNNYVFVSQNQDIDVFLQGKEKYRSDKSIFCIPICINTRTWMPTLVCPKQLFLQEGLNEGQGHTSLQQSQGQITVATGYYYG